jgi:hypothetical protein
MFRIKTTTKNKAVFLSPFVFTEAQAEKKINSIRRWLTRYDWPKFELVPVEKHPEHAVWKELHPIFDPMVNESMRMLSQLEDMWAKLFNREYAKVQKEKGIG